MLARLQRWVLAAAALAAALWLAVCVSLDRPLWAAIGVLAVVAGHAVVLGIEFLIAAVVHGADPAPRAGPVALLRAWLQESWLFWRVFCWQQPFRSQRWADLPGRPGVRGVVFVHGYVCNRGFWNPWLARCHEQGRPCAAVNLEPVFGSLDAYVSAVEQAVARLLHETGLPPVVVAHSMGGLVARAWLSSAPGQTGRVHRIVTIGTPHHGTWLARLSSTENSRLMRRGSAWLTALAARERSLGAEAIARCFTCFYSHADNIVMPPSTAALDGADNRHLRAMAHVAMADHAEVISEVERWLVMPAAAGSGAASTEPPGKAFVDAARASD